ncbi:filaggrin-2-like isoform X2 [Mytilus trossulus]|uniref:filaggrin-2-like isoform X2 n=1 Tax=Mytilus trossulus TaxID=6551 RepID=UPI0030040096
MANEASAELFLDILTKEEREALLNKKMEEIRKKNDALRKRHEEIQKDKKVAASLFKPLPTEPSGSNSPTKEKQTYPNDRKYTDNMDQPRKNNKPVGRGKPRPKSGGDFNHVQDMHITRNSESRNVQLKDDNNRFQNSGDDEYRFRQDTPKRFSFGENDRPQDFRFGEHDDRDASPEHKPYNNDRRGGGNRRNFRGRGSRGGRGGSNDHYKENRSDDFNRQDSWNSNEEYHDKREFRKSGDFSHRQDSRGRGRGRNDYNRQDSRSSGEDFYDKRDFRNSGEFSRQESRGRGGGNQYNRQGSSNGNRYSGEFKRNSYHDNREQFDDSEFDQPRKRPHGGAQDYHDDRPEGPPPDPSYNFLSDRSREGMQHKQQQDRSDRREPPRRHPKNFGGQDFSNVKNQMKNVKERQNRNGPPKSKFEMTVTMTGKERREYFEWKADRDRVDNARIERQKSSSGEWKREWDKEKFESDEAKQTEPAKRPAGRIGSGRFDRGEMDERHKASPEEAPRVSSEMGRQRPETPTKSRGEAPPRGHGEPSPRGRGNRHPDTPPRMAAGRGRGRGRGKAKSANEAKPQRVRSTSSGDDRVVNCDSDLLVIKLENTPGDNSVEVEYSDGEAPVRKTSTGKQKRGGATGTATHGAQTEELWWDEDDDLTMSLIQDGLEGDDVLEHRPLFDDGEHKGDEDTRDLVVGEDEDEWEDCDDDSFYSTEKSQTSTDSREGYHGNQLTVNTQLNPDAPEFTPTSPLSSPNSRSPREKRLKTKHAQNGQRSKAEEQNRSSSKKDEDKKGGQKSKTGQLVSDNETAKDQKGTEKKKEGCEKSGLNTTDQKVSEDTSGQEAKDGTDQKVREDTEVSKGLTDLQEGGKVEMDSSKETDSLIKSKEDLITSSIDDDVKKQKAHSETASKGRDDTSAEGVVTKEVETSGSVSGEDNATTEESVEDTSKSEGGSEDTTLLGDKDTTSVGVKDTTEVDIKDTTEVGVKDTTEVDVKDTTEVDVKDTTEVGVKDTTDVVSKDSTEVGVKETTEVVSKDSTEVGVNDTTEIVSKETKEVVSEDTTVDGSNNTLEVGVTDTKEVEAEDTKTSDDSSSGAGTMEQMADKETNEDAVNDKKLEESSKDDQKEPDQ